MPSTPPAGQPPLANESHSKPAGGLPSLIIGGERHPIADLAVSTWLDGDDVVAFDGADRVGRSITELIVHESVTWSRADTERVLLRRGLGIHLMVDVDGHVTQHGDLADDRLAHAAGHNGPSVGLEVITPYYPPKLRWRGGRHGRKVIKAPWAHKRRYVVPTKLQLESVAMLIEALTGDAAPLAIPRAWVGLRNGRLRMGLLGNGRTRQSGIWAHHYSAHADGAFPVLYAYLRIEEGLPITQAYARAVELATGARGWVRP